MTTCVLPPVSWLPHQQRLTELIALYIRAVAEDIEDRRPPAEAP